MPPTTEDLTVAIRTLQSVIDGLRIDELPSVALDRLTFADALPMRTSAVYFIASASRGLLYIGKAGNLRSRWMPVRGFIDTSINMNLSHSKLGKSVDPGDARLHWWAIPRDCIAIAESLLIQSRKPAWNNHRG